MTLLRRYPFLIVYLVILTLFTGYVLLDAFALERVYRYVDYSANSISKEAIADTATDISTNEVPQSEAISTARSYQDDAISISISQYRENDTDIYVADVVVSDVAYLKTLFASDIFGKNVTETTSSMAKRSQALLAINGDYYGSRDSGYVLRNGTLYRNSVYTSNQEDLVIWQDGGLSIISEGEVSAQSLLEQGAVQVFSFGPALVEDSEIGVSQNEEVGKAKASNPRTAIGVISELHYVFVVSDGRTDESAGLSLYELAQFMKGLDATTAYNLDGGGSTTLWFLGEVVNNPTTNGSNIEEREVSDIVYIGY